MLIPNGTGESSRFIFENQVNQSTASLSITLLKKPRTDWFKATMQVPSEWRNSRRGFPSFLSIADEGMVPEEPKESMMVLIFAKNIDVRFHLVYPATKVAGKPRFDNSTWDEDLRFAENVCRRAVSIAMLWHYAGIDARPEEQREALLEAGYVRLGPW
ncbi:MAG TPA: hypothetical protein PKY51_09970, partial [Fimbriimonadaceae bacterium]|nr:hypothetical protein [Fimbriimonadaceae bacterium]